uniref:ORF501 n=1 Tax=Sargassum thunbergii TaxID=127542 RepID=A0A109QT17_9PHAE|nr:ORF501 [Sargassum thunbergii]AMB49117.1 ORF501 [Sargassum thunbergii]
MVNINVMSNFPNNLNFTNLFTKNTYRETNTNVSWQSIINRTRKAQSCDIYGKYKNYHNLKNSAKVYKKLNNIKIYLLAKSSQVNGEDFNSLIPISTLDDLSNSGYAKTLTSRVGIFQMKTKSDFKNKRFNESIPGNHPFLLTHTIMCDADFDGIPIVSLDDLKITQERGLYEKELLEDESLKLQEQFIIDNNSIGRIIRYPIYDDLEVNNYIFLDNNIFTNVQCYYINSEDSVDNDEKTFLDKLKDFNLINLCKKEKKIFFFLDNENLFHSNKDELLNRNIIPIFSNLEDAQDLLITIIEEILEPYKKYNSTFITNVDYIDDSLNFKKRVICYKKKIQNIKSWLIKHRIIKYNVTLYENYENYSNNRNQQIYINEFDQVLFSIIGNTKIVSMGLGDFLYFWNNRNIMSGEVLSIPSSNEFQKAHPLLSIRQKKSKDRFYEYQKEFQNKNTENILYYRYEINDSASNH